MDAVRTGMQVVGGSAGSVMIVAADAVIVALFFDRKLVFTLLLILKILMKDDVR